MATPKTKPNPTKVEVRELTNPAGSPVADKISGRIQKNAAKTRLTIPIAKQKIRFQRTTGGILGGMDAGEGSNIGRDSIRETILHLLRLRGLGKTICPSEVARTLAEDWRPLMHEVRAVARAMAQAQELAILQRGHRVDPDHLKGPIRLGLVARSEVDPRRAVQSSQE